jgi:hypothetical protein
MIVELFYDEFSVSDVRKNSMEQNYVNRKQTFEPTFFPFKSYCTYLFPRSITSTYHLNCILYTYSHVRGSIETFPDWIDNEITINTRWEATQRVMEAKLTILTHRIAIQPHLVAESYAVCSFPCRRTVRKLLDTPSYTSQHRNRVCYSYRKISFCAPVCLFDMFWCTVELPCCIQNFPDWSPGTRTTNGTALCH